MNREAVALGTPVLTAFEGRLGAVDERLLAEGRMRRLERPDQLTLVKRSGEHPRAPACAEIRRCSWTCWRPRPTADASPWQGWT